MSHQLITFQHMEPSGFPHRCTNSTTNTTKSKWTYFSSKAFCWKTMRPHSKVCATYTLSLPNFLLLSCTASRYFMQFMQSNEILEAKILVKALNFSKFNYIYNHKIVIPTWCFYEANSYILKNTTKHNTFLFSITWAEY